MKRSCVEPNEVQTLNGVHISTAEETNTRVDHTSRKQWRAGTRPENPHGIETETGGDAMKISCGWLPAAEGSITTRAWRSPTSSTADSSDHLDSTQSLYHDHDNDSLHPQTHRRVLALTLDASMGPEKNISSKLALEKQIEEGAGDVIQLKRARNSLLNISRMPPEILGDIFRWNIIPIGDFEGIQNGSYNFLLVCHHWFEVASKSPELWSFWGNTIYQWSRRYQLSGVNAPVDLALAYDEGDIDDTPFDEPLQSALQARVASNSIRSVHLQGRRTLHHSIISSLTPNDKEVRYISIESVILMSPGLDASDFFAHYHFPKLRRLHLSVRVNDLTWNHLASHTTALTSLILKNMSSLSTLSTSKILSILASNPQLRTLHLVGSTIPHDSGDESESRVPLRHLKNIAMLGDFHPVFRLLRRLDHPSAMDVNYMSLFNCTSEAVSRTFGPFLRDCLLRDGRFLNQLVISVELYSRWAYINAAVAGDTNGLTLSPVGRPPFLTFSLSPRDDLPPQASEKLFANVVAQIPGEYVVSLKGTGNLNVIKEAVTAMPNIRRLQLVDVPLSDGFLQPDPCGSHANTKLLPSLRYLHLHDTVAKDWRPLIPYLIHQTSGGQAVSLRITGESVDICPSVMERIKELVEELVLELTWDGSFRSVRGR
ncbi:hypothetical protein BJ322DRAFT_185346 [Thelephora terrestris]|uniref:F-box domain-containing protein n=1 Tax=Thelephora terrestris TaxID=56493 RepID=A0A9P6L5C5_9AGAM|nr:hypothetical protein BJ322DRAFT_185346 [Thelephora terrestris]